MSTHELHSSALYALLRRALVFNHIYDALIVTADDGTIVDWNAGAERMFGWAREEVLGKAAAEVHQPRSLAAPDDSILEVVQRIGRWQESLSFVRKDGEAGNCEAAGLRLIDAGGKSCGALFVFVEGADAPPAEPAPIGGTGASAPRDEGASTARQLRDERFLLRKLIDAVPDPIF